MSWKLSVTHIIILPLYESGDKSLQVTIPSGVRIAYIKSVKISLSQITDVS